MAQFFWSFRQRRNINGRVLILILKLNGVQQRLLVLGHVLSCHLANVEVNWVNRDFLASQNFFHTV